MNVLFDISILGAWNSTTHSRTGIFRVVENLARGLDESEVIKTTFCSSQNNICDCLKYMDSSTFKFKSALSKQSNLLSLLYDSVEPLRFEIAKLPQGSWKIPLRRAYNLGKKHLLPVAHSDIIAADIYHSPAYIIPDQIRTNRRIHKFITIHDLIPLIHPEYFDSHNNEYLKKILASITENTFVTCVSESTKNDLLSHMPMLAPDRVSVVYLAADDHFYPCRDCKLIEIIKSKYNIPLESDYFLALSTLQPRKNFDVIIKSFIKILRAEKIKHLKLVLVGANGWNYDKIYKEIIKSGELGKSIILTGYVPDDDLAPLYSGATAFLYPSLYEGFGLPPLEAMQCGTPVITSNNSSLPEVVGDAAIMIDPNDVDSLCQSMLDLYKSSKLRSDMSLASIERAKYFDWNITTRETIDAYRKAINNK